LESILQLSSVIHVDVLTEAPEQIPDGVLAFALPLKFVAVKIPELAQQSKRVPVQWSSGAFVNAREGVFTVPLSLAKEMKLQYEVPDQAPISLAQMNGDMLIIINPKVKFWYGDVDVPYVGRYELETILAHEILVCHLCKKEPGVLFCF
jgi:hypothetical protein